MPSPTAFHLATLTFPASNHGMDAEVARFWQALLSAVLQPGMPLAVQGWRSSCYPGDNLAQNLWLWLVAEPHLSSYPSINYLQYHRNYYLAQEHPSSFFPQHLRGRSTTPPKTPESTKMISLYFLQGMFYQGERPTALFTSSQQLCNW